MDAPGSKLKIVDLGLHGVNVDKDPLELDDSELTHAQNATSENAALRKRLGFIEFNATFFDTPVLGGVGVPMVNLSSIGLHLIYLGRGGVPT